MNDPSDRRPRVRRVWPAALAGLAAIAGVACGTIFRSGNPELAIDAGSDAGEDASHVASPDDDGGVVLVPPQTMPDSAVCTPGARHCAANGGVEICGTDDQWGSPVACASGSVCADGACIAPSLDGGVVIPTSCLGGGAGIYDCGDSGVESCCTSLEVEGGTFYRTYTWDPDSGLVTGEADPASVSGFRLDKYEVTVGRFRQFVNAVLPSDAGVGWSPAQGSGKHAHLNGGSGLVNVSADAGPYEPGWSQADDVNVAPTTNNLTVACTPSYFATWTESPTHNERLPAVCQNWWEAYAFCIWDGGFLPSEAEWTYASAGGSNQRRYPWGATEPGTANAYAIFDCHYGPATCDSIANIAPVGTAVMGLGRWGQLDLAGNVSERAMDAADPLYVVPCADCADVPNAGSSTPRVHRGGWYNNPDTSHFGARAGLPPSFRGSGAGIRCARAP